MNGIPARVWTYAVPAAAESNRRVLTATAYASDVMTLADAVTLDAGLRAELVHGNAEGAAASINWLSLLPHAYLRWQLGTRRALIGGYARSANALNQTWLAYGDPAASVATVAAARATNLIVSRVGPGTGGNVAFSQIDEDLKRPYTDEFTIGFEKRRSASTRYTLTGIARREINLLGVVNTGISAASYQTIGVPDAGTDWDGSGDDRTLLVYNRLPASFGQDCVPGHEPGSGGGDRLRASYELRAEHGAAVPAVWRDRVRS